MCGIVGYWSLDGRPFPEEVLVGMTQTLNHRGPDDHGTVLFIPEGSSGWRAHASNSCQSEGPAEGQGGLGHTRLRVIDVSKRARQPMANDDGTLWITYNGEVYNFPSLRETLIRKGHRFRSTGDTEVVLRAYEEWGEECVVRFNGMFAFGIVDTRRGVLFLARDRLGIKPLYYSDTPGRFVFASEPKAILPCLGASWSLDPMALLDYLVLGYTLSPRSFFKNIKRLEPGQCLTLSLYPRAHGESSGPELKRYWDLEFGCSKGLDGGGDYVDQLREVLQDAVNIRMISDVPLGAFLSGGIDSGVIVSQMKRSRGASAQTFTIGFRDSEGTELDAARETSRRFGTIHRERILDKGILQNLQDVLYFYDEPLADTSVLPTFELCRFAREEVTVCLSGDGADELFGGYWQHERAARAIYAPYLPRFLRFLAARLIGFRPYSIPDTSEVAVRFYGLPLQACIGLGVEGDRWAKRLLHPDLLRTLRGYSPYDILTRYYLKGRGCAMPLDRIQNVDLKAYLPEDILTKIDRASMAFGLEVRVPFLDHRVVELAARLPHFMRVNKGKSKVALKKAFSGFLPETILNRPKQGFSIPENEWFSQGALSKIECALTKSDARISEFLSSDRISLVFEEFRNGIAHLRRLIWGLLILEEWLLMMERYNHRKVWKS